MEQELSYKKLYEGSQRLWLKLASGEDSNAILKEAYYIERNPIIVTADQTLFKSIGVHSNELLDGLFMVGYDEIVKEKQEIVRILPRKLSLQNPQTNYGILCTGIFNKNEYLGRILFLGQNHDFTEVDYELAKTLSVIMSKVFSSELFPQLNTFIPDYPLFHSLISGERLDTLRLRNKLSELNYIPKEGMNIIVIDQRNQPLLSALLNMEKYAHILSTRIYSMYKGNFVAINARSNSLKLSPSDALRNELNADGFHCGISREFFAVSDAKRMYNQSIFALNMREFFDVKNHIVEYETYSAEYSICLSACSAHPVGLLDPRLIKLKEYDDAGPGYLMDTLKVHLENIKTPTEGANALFIHRNTYFHRLAKIQEITGWDINSGDCIAKIGFYLKVVRLLEQADNKNLKNLYYLIKEE